MTTSPRWTPFFPRSYQRPLGEAYRTEHSERFGVGIPVTRSGVKVAHRGSGKGAEVTGLVLLPSIAARPGNYMHAFPTYAQAKKALWSEAWWKAMWPEDWVEDFIETELCVRLRIGGQTARLWLVGADDRKSVDKLRGSNPLGVVYDEAGEMDEGVRELSARLAMNGGWELLIGTPKGKNWFHKAYLNALEHPEFFSQFLTVDDTRKDAVDFDGNPLPGEDGGFVIPPEEIELQRATGKSEAWIQQEYYCAFNASIEGSIFGDRVAEARKAGRITRCVHDPMRPVGVMMDIGRSDATAMIFFQQRGSAIEVIDYDAVTGKYAGEIVQHLLAKPYGYGIVYLPHDAGHETAASQKSVADQFRARMRCRVKVVAKPATKESGIDVARAKFSRLVFDEVACSRDIGPNLPSLLTSLTEYKRAWSAATQGYTGAPVHDETSHAADALRTGLEGFEERMDWGSDEDLQSKTVRDFVPFARVDRPRRRRMEMAA